MKTKRETRRRVKEWAICVVACAAILLVAWGVAMAAVLAFTSAWVRDPMPEVTSVQRQIAIEAAEEVRLE